MRTSSIHRLGMAALACALLAAVPAVAADQLPPVPLGAPLPGLTSEELQALIAYLFGATSSPPWSRR